LQSDFGKMKRLSLALVFVSSTVALVNSTFLRGGVFRDRAHWKRRFGDADFVPRLSERLSRILRPNGHALPTSMPTSSGKPPALLASVTPSPEMDQQGTHLGSTMPTIRITSPSPPKLATLKDKSLSRQPKQFRGRGFGGRGFSSRRRGFGGGGFARGRRPSGGFSSRRFGPAGRKSRIRLVKRLRAKAKSLANSVESGGDVGNRFASFPQVLKPGIKKTALSPLARQPLKPEIEDVDVAELLPAPETITPIEEPVQLDFQANVPSPAPSAKPEALKPQPVTEFEELQLLPVFNGLDRISTAESLEIERSPVSSRPLLPVLPAVPGLPFEGQSQEAVPISSAVDVTTFRPPLSSVADLVQSVNRPQTLNDLPPPAQFEIDATKFPVFKAVPS